MFTIIPKEIPTHLRAQAHVLLQVPNMNPCDLSLAIVSGVVRSADLRSCAIWAHSNSGYSRNPAISNIFTAFTKLCDAEAKVSATLATIKSEMNAIKPHLIPFIDYSVDVDEISELDPVFAEIDDDPYVFGDSE